MVTPKWVPKRGDIIHLDDDGGVGHEQKGDRPHLVLTTQGFNDKFGLVMCIPISTKPSHNDFEHPVTGLPKPSVALLQHLTSADWRGRRAFLKGKVSAAELSTITAKVAAMLAIVHR